jgi:hypothetical protein
LGSLLDAVEEFFFKGLEFLETFLYARLLEARATVGQFLQCHLVGFDDLEQGIIHFPASASDKVFCVSGLPRRLSGICGRIFASRVSRVMPALLTKISIRPTSWAMRATHSLQESKSATSTG